MWERLAVPAGARVRVCGWEASRFVNSPVPGCPPPFYHVLFSAVLSCAVRLVGPTTLPAWFPRCNARYSHGYSGAVVGLWWWVAKGPFVIVTQ